MFSLVLPYRFRMDLPMACQVNFIDETGVISSGNPPDSCEVFIGFFIFAPLLSCVGCVAPRPLLGHALALLLGHALAGASAWARFGGRFCLGTLWRALLLGHALSAFWDALGVFWAGLLSGLWRLWLACARMVPTWCAHARRHDFQPRDTPPRTKVGKNTKKRNF